MFVADAAAVARATPYPALIDALARAFADPSHCVAPPRAHHAMAVEGRADRTMLLMPSWGRNGAAVMKLVTVTPDNAKGLPAVQAQVLVGEAESGAWSMILDGGELTARRTAAASALAARHLARADAQTLFVAGTGRLSRELIAAHAAIRPIRRVLVWGRRVEAAEAVAGWARDRGHEARAASIAEGQAEADILSCATLSEAPLIRGAALRAGQHLDLVGAFRPAMRESDSEAVARSRVFVDTMAGARGEAGDLLQAEADGRFSFDNVAADLAALCSGGHPGRAGDAEITLFKSVGASVEDYAAALLARDMLAG